MYRNRLFLGLAVVSTTAALTLTPVAAAPTVSDPLASGLIGPLQLDATGHGIFVSQSFAGVITHIRRDGSTHDVVMDPGVSGVAADRHGIAYTTNVDLNEDGSGEESATLKYKWHHGKTRTIADLQAFEKRRNPDARNTYGFVGLTPECAAQVPEEIGGEPYRGIVDTNPYALTRWGNGWYVADAGANAILRVARSGKVRVVATLWPQRVRINQAAADAFGLPQCVVGAVYAFEPVPTDVEVDRDGMLYVSLLPGGPEDASLGARGLVLKLNPWNRKSRIVARGLLSSTGIALSPRGHLFVAELFANRVSKIRDGRPVTVAEVEMPAGLDWHDGRLFATTEVFGDGKVVSIRP